MEQAASRLRQYEAEVIPGLVQSPAYARAITTLGPQALPFEAVEQRTAMRMQRQQILTRREPRAPELAYQGPFVILDFPRETQVRDPEPTTIYQESPTGSLYLDKPSEVETYSAVWSGLDTVALDQAASRTLITHRLGGWSP